MIEIKDLTKSFDGVEVLSHISMTLESYGKRKDLWSCWTKRIRKNDADEAYFGFRFAHIRINYN